ncbi:GNAT family N-acetyltransferase [Alkalicella caledoniensis]|uniref:GNAT family N-acetyltransferase n=1 Tax=Alkalicella caledoniensis TaxID=2731377 RepID=A0A7G9W657_ALKCA|nr:GNAT family N-acetyltransferase [Alkalicella caledoniensis]QNO14169.1 GNAT family N-acetyltransferase [Alkalicella caledoniensis]
MLQIQGVKDKDLKSVICDNILRDLPNWFGIEESIIEYKKTSKDIPFYAVYNEDKAIGFVAIKVHNPYTAEVYVMGTLKEYHRKGIGRMLINKCEEYCKENGMEFLTVKTLDESRASESYEKTRQFYLAMGFRPLEVFKTLWDENNPCLFMAKYIQK